MPIHKLKSESQAIQAVTDSYEVLKWPWIVITGFSLSKGIDSYYKYFADSLTHPNAGAVLLPTIAIFIYLATLFRLYTGISNRFAACKQQAVESLKEGGQHSFNNLYSVKRRIIDAALLPSLFFWRYP